ncbi:MAG: YjbQ family protein [Candidatus Marinimicrobia bacterium]|nr:YjbQ family protein [Candidatus Neomarinimicrobiota bacterium]
MEIMTLQTNQRNQFVDITDKIREVIKKFKVIDGHIVIYSPHTTSGITINENADPNVLTDMQKKLNTMVPPHENYTHLEGNSDSHIKSTLVGNSVQIIVENGQLMLGTWQGIFFCEFDGPRRREIWIKLFT